MNKRTYTHDTVDGVLLGKTQRVLELTVANPLGVGRVAFAAHDEDTGMSRTGVTFDWQSWQDMGSPTEITVTIEPGDLLNAEEPREPEEQLEIPISNAVVHGRATHEMRDKI